MLPFPNDLKHFQICPTFDLAEIGQNVGLVLNDQLPVHALFIMTHKKNDTDINYNP